MAYLGGATLAWQSDYCQFYLVDGDWEAFVAPTDISAEMTARCWATTPAGLVVYTEDCLTQLIEIRLFDAPPAQDPTEWRSAAAWTRIEEARVTFPSARFTVSSPSRTGTEAVGPWLMVGAGPLIARLQWLEVADGQYEANRPHADVIRVDLWPA